MGLKIICEKLTVVFWVWVASGQWWLQRIFTEHLDHHVPFWAFSLPCSPSSHTHLRLRLHCSSIWQRRRLRLRHWVLCLGFPGRQVEQPVQSRVCWWPRPGSHTLLSPSLCHLPHVKFQIPFRYNVDAEIITECLPCTWYLLVTRKKNKEVG